MNKEYDYLDSTEFINQLDKKINDIVKMRTISDRKEGSFLSGGIDSSLITYYLQNNLLNQLILLQLDFEDNNYDESKVQKKYQIFWELIIMK